jgi:hypothetical protein
MATTGYMGVRNEWHSVIVTKASISPLQLNQPLTGRSQEVVSFVIIIVI